MRDGEERGETVGKPCSDCDVLLPFSLLHDVRDWDPPGGKNVTGDAAASIRIQSEFLLSSIPSASLLP